MKHSSSVVRIVETMEPLLVVRHANLPRMFQRGRPKRIFTPKVGPLTRNSHVSNRPRHIRSFRHILPSKHVNQGEVNRTFNPVV
jgi:hypothetical protein